MITAVFMGTPAAAVPVLGALRDVAELGLVVTRPDKPRGRSKRPQSSAIKEAALEWQLPLAQPGSGSELTDVVRAVAPDVVVVAAYGRLIRPELLELPRHGFVNVHYSLLPRWRGASPVVRAILAGDSETGVSLMEMDAGLDTGPVIARAVVPIDSLENTGDLTDRLAVVGGRLLVGELPRFLAGDVSAVPQDDGMATAAAKVTSDEAHIDPTRHSARAVDRAVRAFNPKPGAWCLLDGGRFKIWAALPAPGMDSTPGRVLMVDGRVILGAGDGAVEVTEVQPAGKPRMIATAWMNGRRGEPADLR